MHFIHNYLNKYYTDIKLFILLIIYTKKNKQTNKQTNKMLYSYLKNIKKANKLNIL